MADTTYAVKVNYEVKERLQKLVDESGLTSKDFFADMVSQFELFNAKKQTPILAADIDELVKLTTRINNIFINVGERVYNLQEGYTKEIDSAIKEKESLISLLQQQVETLKQEAIQMGAQSNDLLAENKVLKETKEALEKASSSEINQLKEVNQKNNELMHGYNEKINTLSGLVNEYKAYSNENKILKNEIAEIRIVNEQIQKENEKLNALVLENKKRFDELEHKYIKEMDIQKERFELDRDKLLLKQREEYNKELDGIRASYNNKINQLLQLNTPKKESK